MEGNKVSRRQWFLGDRVCVVVLPTCSVEKVYTESGEVEDLLQPWDDVRELEHQACAVGVARTDGMRPGLETQRAGVKRRARSWMRGLGFPKSARDVRKRARGDAPATHALCPEDDAVCCPSKPECSA